MELGAQPGIRLNKFLARTGISSRRGADRLIEEGRVAVNGEAVRTLGMRVAPEDRVTVDGVPVTPAERPFWAAVHKPPGVLTTLRDPQGRPDLAPLVARFPVRAYPVGRLDIDSEGLLLLMNEGELAYRLTHPRYTVEKEYRVEVSGDVPRDLPQRLRDGVVLEDGPARAVRAEFIALAERAAAVRLTLTEGRKREIRRMMDTFGLVVRRLVRERIGVVRLDDLAPGGWRTLTREEVDGLWALVGERPR